MKLVIWTQHRENYGAHAWDGKGECPQYWKCKGGDTYVIDVNVEEAMSEAYYDDVFACINSFSEYFEEYVIGSDLIDDIDYNESTVVEEWETPIHAFLLPDRSGLFCVRAQKSYSDDQVIAERSWTQSKGGLCHDMKYREIKEAA